MVLNMPVAKPVMMTVAAPVSVRFAMLRTGRYS